MPPNGGNGWKTWVLGVAAMLLVGGIGGAAGTVIAQHENRTKIEALEERQDDQSKVLRGALERIDDKLERIADSIADLRVEGAKYHHTHSSKAPKPD